MRLETYLINSDYLNEIEIFRYASNNELDLLRNASIIKSFPKGKIVINENELPSHVFFILTGSCHVQLNGMYSLTVDQEKKLSLKTYMREIVLVN